MHCQEIIVASKVAGRSQGLKYLRDNGVVSVTKKDILEGVDKILGRLDIDYVDLLQIHWPDRYVSLFGQPPYDAANEWDAVPFEEQLEGLKHVIDQGKVRYVGVSNETSYGVGQFIRASEEAKGLPRIVSIQNSYSMIGRSSFETDLSETCSKSNYNVGLLAYSPLAGGTLTGKYIQEGGPPEGSRFVQFPTYMERFQTSRMLGAVKGYCEIACKHKLTPAQLALAFVKSRWFVASTIIGATTMEQLKENIDAFNIELSDEILAEIDEVYKLFRDPAAYF